MCSSIMTDDMFITYTMKSNLSVNFVCYRQIRFIILINVGTVSFTPTSSNLKNARLPVK